MINHPFGKELGLRLGSLAIAPPPGTVYFALAEELQLMAVSYHNDGEHFLSSGDTVNAIAAFSYGLGWVDTASCLGLVTVRQTGNQWLFSNYIVPETESGHLAEKVERYVNMLSSALKNVSCAPEAGTGIKRASDRILCACNVLKEFGDRFQSLGRLENALGSYSYAHAWLDAGIRAGLFCIEGKHDLFAV